MEFCYLPVFVKRLKELSKKYPSLRVDFANLLELLRKFPKNGIPLGKDCDLKVFIDYINKHNQ